MAYISNSKTILEHYFQKRKYLMGPTLPKKEILMAYISDPKVILELKLPKKEILMRPTLQKAENTAKQAIFSTY
jgi:hypothetical protein